MTKEERRERIEFYAEKLGVSVHFQEDGKRVEIHLSGPPSMLDIFSYKEACWFLSGMSWQKTITEWNK